MPLWLADQPLVLASKSAVRRTLLTAAGIPIEVRPADVDERGLEEKSGTRDPAAIAALLGREKARAVSAVMPGRLVLGADQTLALGPRLFTKPADLSEARAQLLALRGQSHELHAAIALLRDGAVIFEHSDVARLTMRNFSDSFLDAYIESVGDAVMASVGCYQLEKTGVHLFERVEGDHFTILGLPLVALLHALRRAGSLTG